MGKIKKMFMQPSKAVPAVRQTRRRYMKVTFLRSSFEMERGTLSIESPRCQRVTWKIPMFFHLSTREGYYVKSPVFCFAGPHHLRLYPNINGRVSVCMFNTKDISYNIRFQSSSGAEIHLHHVPFPPQRYPEIGAVFCVLRHELQADRDSYVPNGIFTLNCYLIQKSSAESSESKEENREPGVADLQSDYRQLLQKGTDSDAFFEVSGKEFRAHRCILRARSPVFDAMFGHPMAEKESGRVVIDDLDPDCFVHFLEYLYTGVVGTDLLDSHAFGLYKAADKYGVLSLKSECVAHMRRTLTVDSFCDVLSLSEMHCEEELLQLAVSFFKQNLRRIIVTQKWQQFLIDNSKTANELFMKALLPERH